MADEKVTYLEDVQSPAVDALSSSQRKSETPSDAVTNAGTKRQLTLADMLGSKEKSTSEPSLKRTKIAASGAAGSSFSNRTITISGPAPPKLNSIPFSVAAFQDSLTPEQRDLLKLECEVMGRSWLKVLKDEIKQPYFLSLKKFLCQEGVRWPEDSRVTPKVYPPARNIYAWSNTPLGRVKVVILGQDPYHGKGQAHGLCFSVPRSVPVPPSLKNIYTELKREYPEFQVPNHGNLETWAVNGVLMLNTCLTVRAGDANSHSGKGWEPFTDRVVDVVDRYGGANLGGTASNGIGRGVVFLAWGASAAKRVAKLNKEKHLILTSSHPSPFSVDKGFRGNNHFKLANQWLEKRYGEDGKVNWCQLGGKEEGEEKDLSF